MLNFGDATYEADLRSRNHDRAWHANRLPAPQPLAQGRRSLAETFRGAMARLGDLLITVGCELEVRYLTEGRTSACAG